MSVRIALIGARGAIAANQHLPTLEDSSQFTLAATVDLSRTDPVVSGVPHYQILEALLRSEPDITAVSVATPTSTHYPIVRKLLLAGKDVLVEKPPTVSVRELQDLRKIAKENDRVLVTGFHTKHNPAVSLAKRMLASETIIGGSIDWLECFAHYHPGQAFCWKKGGAGVFDPGINALAVLVEVLDQEQVWVSQAHFEYPHEAEEPGRVNMTLALPENRGNITVRFDWLRDAREEDRWDVSLHTKSGKHFLIEGVRTLKVDGSTVLSTSDIEYPSMYAHFHECLASRVSSVSTKEMRLIMRASTIATSSDTRERVKLDR